MSRPTSPQLTVILAMSRELDALDREVRRIRARLLDEIDRLQDTLERTRIERDAALDTLRLIGWTPGMEILRPADPASATADADAIAPAAADATDPVDPNLEIGYPPAPLREIAPGEWR